VIENTPATRLLVGRSVVRNRILGLLMAEPGRRLHLREIQRQAETSPGTASRELGRLLDAGLVEREAEGHQVYFRAATSPYATSLRALLLPQAAPDAPDTLDVGNGFPAAAATDGPGEGGSVDAEADADGEADTDTAPTTPLLTEPAITAPDTPRPARTIQPVGVVPRGKRGPDPTGLRVAARLAEVLRPLYAGRLIGVFLSGGRARGETRADADVEIVVVLDSVAKYGDELERTSVTCAGLSLEFGVIVSRVFVSESAWKTRTDGHFPALRLEAVAV
jgi:DNA-binding transcriptional ArsR family regulator